VVVVGVTGHRVLAEVDRLKDGLEQVVRRVQAAFPGDWTVASALAEGADRMVVRRLLARDGTRLLAVLPLPRHGYETGFADAVSTDEFGDLLRRADEVVEVASQPGHDGAYEAAGLAVLQRSDVLIAVWDGQAAQGRGGTGGILAEARRRGLPVAWVHAGNRRPGTLEPTSLGAEQGSVTFERFPGEPRPAGESPGGVRGR